MFGLAGAIVFDTKYNLDTIKTLANWGADPAVLIVLKDSPFNSPKDLVDFAKKNPGKASVNGGALYNGHHIAFLQLAKALGADLTYIPEKGVVPTMHSVIAGKVKSGFNNLADSYRNSDRLKILAVADVERHEFLADVPTLKEEGFDVDDACVNMIDMAFAKGVPQHIIDKCADIIPKMFKDKKVLKKMNSSGSPVKIMNRDQVIKTFKERQAFLKPLLEELRK